MENFEYIWETQQVVRHLNLTSLKMQYHLELNSDNKYDLVYKSGEIRTSNIESYEFFGDDYYLVKNRYSNYPNLLTNDGELLFGNYAILHRFIDGRLLTLEKQLWENSKKDGLDTGYWRYDIYNHSDKSFTKVYDLTNSYCDVYTTIEKLDFRTYSFARYFYNSLYLVNNFIFSELFDSRFLIFAHSSEDLFFKSKTLTSISIEFSELAEKEIWNLLDLTSPNTKLVENKKFATIAKSLLINHSDPTDQTSKLSNIELKNSKTLIDMISINKWWEARS